MKLSPQPAQTDMRTLLEISQNSERFARFAKHLSVATIMGFVAVVSLLLADVLTRV